MSSIVDPGAGAIDPPRLDVVIGDGKGDASSALLALTRVSVIIPTRNEATRIAEMVECIPDGVHEVILVDGHSTDDTVVVAQNCRRDIVVLEQTGIGKGNALTCGLRAATGDCVVVLDGDGSSDPAEIPRFAAALLAGAEYAKGTRFLPGGRCDDASPMRRLAHRGVSFAVNLLWGVNYTDLHCGYNAFWRSCLESLAPDGNGLWVETLMNIRAARSGLVVHEVLIREHGPRGVTSYIPAYKDSIRVLRTMLALRIRPD
jgi:glycosyltransferase involved in cell wall biosynthesis